MNLPHRYDEPVAAAVDAGGRGLGSAAPLATEDRLSFGLVLNLLRRRLRLFLLCFATVFMFGVLITMLQPKVYEATATVLLKTSGKSMDEKVTNDTGEKVVTGDADVATQLQVIQSLDMSKRVVRSLRLIENPAVNPFLAPRRSLVDRITGNEPKAIDVKALPPEERERMITAVAGFLRGNLATIRIGTAFTAAIAFRSTDPTMAAAIANGFAREYAQSQLVDKTESTSEATAFLTSKVEQLRQQATTDFAAVQNYRIRNGLLSSSATSLTEQDISVYNQQAAAARAEAAADRARLATARQQLRSGSAGDDVGEALSSSVVSSLRSQRAQIGARVADLSARYGGRHPELLRAKEELASVDGQIQAEIDRVISNLEAKAAVSTQRVASLDGSVGSAKGELARNNGAMVALADLQKRADASQGLYESYLSRYRELVAGSGTEQPDARVLTEASAPWVPASPKVKLNLLLAGLTGLVLGLVVALATELQFKGLTTAQDVEKRVGLPSLGLTPENNSLDHHAETPLATLIEMPDSVLAEAVRGIYGSTHIPVVGRGTVLAVTSALPNEGKTVLSAMLGETASRAGTRTVVVDCDIMLRGLSVLHGMQDGPGIREFVAGECTLHDVLRGEQDGAPAILPITSRPLAGERLIDKGAIQRIVAQLKENFDLVVLDCPPLLAIAEAREITGLADGIIIAAHWRKTPDEAVRAAARLLPARLVDYTGVVLSRVDLRKQARYADDDAAPYSTSYQRYVAAAS